MLESLIISRMRVQILVRLFFNPQSRAYLREMAGEFGSSPGHVRSELLQLVRAGLLCTEKQGRRVFYRAATDHPLYPELHSMVHKAVGIDKAVAELLEQLDSADEAYVVGDYALGRDSGTVELLLVGDVDQTNLAGLIRKAGRHLRRKVTVQTVSCTDKASWFERNQHIPHMRTGGGDGHVI